MLAVGLLLQSAAAHAATVLITGANSGIGLEFTKQYAATGWDVIATHRRDEIPESLREVIAQYPNVRAERMDVTSRDQIYALAEKLRDEAIDILLNNAGLFLIGADWHENAESEGQAFGTFDWDQFDAFVATNIRGPIMIAEAFVDHVRASVTRAKAGRVCVCISAGDRQGGRQVWGDRQVTGRSGCDRPQP